MTTSSLFCLICVSPGDGAATDAEPVVTLAPAGLARDADASKGVASRSPIPEAVTRVNRTDADDFKPARNGALVTNGIYPPCWTASDICYRELLSARFQSTPRLH